MKKLYELDASKEFNDIPSDATSSEDISGMTAGNFEGVSGVGIEEVSEEEDQANINSLQDMLAKLNTHSDEEMSRAVEEEAAERERYRLEEEERLRLAKERFNRERYEREQEALRLKKEKEKEEEEQRRLEEEEAMKNSFGYKFKKMFQKSESEKDSDLEKEDKKEAKRLAKEEKERQKELRKQEEKERQLAEKQKKKEEEEEKEVREKKEPVEIEKHPLEEEAFAPEPEELEATRGGSFEDELGEDFEEQKEKEKKEEKEETEEEEKQEQKKESEKKKGFSFAKILPKKQEEKKKEEKAKEESRPAASMDDEPDWKWIATHDELTGLLNTRAYAEDLKKMPKKFGVVFFDVNNLKFVNDNHGHDVGDNMLKEIVNTIRSEYGENHLYRTGGDEFVFLIESPSKHEDDKISEKNTNIHNKLAEISKKSPEKITYSVSVGYAFGDGKAEKEEVVKAADAAMYQNKKAYKMRHKEQDAREKEKAAGSEVKAPTKEHDELLTKEQKTLKTKIQDEHEKASKGSTQTIIREIQKRSSEIEAIFIASPSFDHLFVITDIEDFLDIMDRQQALIDYSYLYIVYAGGPQYYGADEYYKEVTHLFEAVSDALMSGKFRSEKDIQNIPGINIFKNIYV